MPEIPKERKALIYDYAQKNVHKIGMLKNYLLIKNMPFGPKNALNAIFDKTQNYDEVSRIIMNMCKPKDKRYGPQVQNDAVALEKMTFKENPDGTIELVGYEPGTLSFPEKKGHEDLPSKKYTKAGGVKKYYTDTKDRVDVIGQAIKKVYPNLDTDEIVDYMQFVREYAAVRKISTYGVAKAVEAGKLKIIKDYNGDFHMRRVMSPDKPSVESKKPTKVIFSESIFKRMVEDVEGNSKITFYAFNYAVRRFLSMLLKDPANAMPEEELSTRGLTRGRMIRILINNGLLIKDSKIVDQDENGNLVTATMDVKFRVPKKNFERKLKRLYIKLFEKNLPPVNGNVEEVQPMEIEEDGGATSANVSAAGSFVQPVFPIVRRKLKG